ncbi:MAG TPA: VOC family protein [Actinomycetes bacterium]|nr:VOC family protein [Actinomycetes bacterium]
MINGVSKVVVEVEDQDRAKEFWTGTMGFEVVQDSPYGEERWLEVRTPDKNIIMVLSVRRGPSARSWSIPESLPTSSVLFYCDDLQQTYQELTARGVEFAQPPVQMPFGWWSMFRDPDGTRYALTPRGQ